MSEAAQSVAVDLRRNFVAAREATKAVQDLLTEAGAYGLLHDATLAVTELVTNTVVRSTGECQLVARYNPDRARLRVEIVDFEPRRELSEDTELRAESHRFPFVAALATEWGVTARPDGKIIWFEMLDCQVSDIPV